MSSAIERQLRMKAQGGDQAGRVLLAQWEFDSRLMAQALQSIHVSFPHFSLHDASHSESILAYIGKVLGPSRIAKLSATDLWMLLSVAYYHDSGMIVSHDEAIASYEKGDLREHIQNTANNPGSELHKEAHILSHPIDFKEATIWPFEVRRALTLLIADFYRPRHADRAIQVATNPSIHGIASPRTTLIPARLWRLLGSVCKAHGEGFQAILKLPCVENGVFSDNAHPRFAAAFLRLGDLLDLDNGRFCPTLSLTFGAPPPSTHAHRGKHAAIHHFRVDDSVIEVDAKCEADALDVFDATSHWLNLLQNELRDLSYHWKDISPASDFGAPPSAGRIEVTMPGQIPGFQPRFSLNTAKLLPRFRDSGLYSSPYEAVVRELLQNAHDATTMRLAEMGKLRFELPIHTSEIRKVYQDLPIKVSLSRKDAAEDFAQWTLTVKDSGVGMTREDVERIRDVGSPNRKKSDAREIPEFLWPSGAFGIGLQSAFLLTDKVEIKTRSARDKNPLHVTLEKDRGVIVREWKDDKQWEFGTEVSIVFTQRRTVHEFSARPGPALEEMVQEYDPLNPDAELSVAAALVVDAVEVHSRSLHSKVEFSLSEDPPRPTSPTVDEKILPSGISLTGGYRSHYRGLAIDDIYWRLPILEDWGVLVRGLGIHYGHSNDMLTLNRQHLRPECVDDLRSRFRAALPDIITLIPGVGKRAGFRSWILHVLRTQDQDPRWPISLPSDDHEWHQLDITAEGENSLLLGTVEELWGWESRDPRQLHISPENPRQGNPGLRACFSDIKALFPLFPHIEYHGDVSGEPLYRLSSVSRRTSDALPKEHIRTILKRIFVGFGHHLGIGHRWLVPMPFPWIDLSVKAEDLWYFYKPLFPMPTWPATVLPFRVVRHNNIVDGTGALVANSIVTIQDVEYIAPWIRKNSAIQPTPNNVEERLIDFMRHIDGIIRDLASDPELSITCDYDLEAEIRKIK